MLFGRLNSDGQEYIPFTPIGNESQSPSGATNRFSTTGPHKGASAIGVSVSEFVEQVNLAPSGKTPVVTLGSLVADIPTDTSGGMKVNADI